MKSFLQFSFFTLILTALFTTGCGDDRCTRTQEYTEYQPVFKRIDEMRTPATYVAPVSLKEPGKLFYANGYLFVNEMHKGIHVIDNRNPEAPQNVGFIEVPGNLDMAVNNGILYCDSYLDLVAIDISNPTAPVEVNRVQDVFQSFYSFDQQLGYLVEYVPTDVKRTIDCSNPNWGNQLILEGDVLLASSEFDGGGPRFNSNSSITPSVVAGGSMARFTIASDHLYTIDGSEIKIFDVTQSTPVLRNEVSLVSGIETLFPLAGSLFIGSNSGLIIYDISNPDAPQYLSTFSHATACDPVVVEGTTAYVTLRDGNTCQGFVNQLDIVDVSNLSNPNLIESYPMENPHGLSVQNGILYLCEGASGLKVFDVDNPHAISEFFLGNTTKGFFAYDVIVLPGEHVIVVGKDGLHQFDTSNKGNVKKLSVITIED